MEEMKIEWHTEGFVKDAGYSFYVHEVIEPFKDEFPGAEKLIINIREVHYFELALPRKQPLVISADKKSITINDSVSRFYDNKGRETSKPDPQSVLAGLRHLMEHAAKEYNKKTK
jgi:hypothetical protein